MKKKLSMRALTMMSSVCMACALSILSTLCRFWLYDPPVPKALQEMDI